MEPSVGTTPGPPQSAENQVGEQREPPGEMGHEAPEEGHLEARAAGGGGCEGEGSGTSPSWLWALLCLTLLSPVWSPA